MELRAPLRAPPPPLTENPFEPGQNGAHQSNAGAQGGAGGCTDWGRGVGAPGLRRQADLASKLALPVAVWSPLDILNLGFLLCKMELGVPTSQGHYRNPMR